MKFAFVLALAVFAVLFAGARADECEGQPDDTPCEDYILDTIDDYCLGGVCQGRCVPPLYLVGNFCVVLCPALSPPDRGSFVNASNCDLSSVCSACMVVSWIGHIVDFQVGTVCTSTCTAPAIRTSGDSSRRCAQVAGNFGNWTGNPLVCQLPPACLSSPCRGSSLCVDNSTLPSRFECQCSDGATGTPGADGSGCVIPSIITSGTGNITITVSDQDDVIFNLGNSNTLSILGFDSTITSINRNGGAIDQRASSAVAAAATLAVTTAEAQLADQVSAFENSLSQQVASLTSTSQSTIASQAASASVSAQADASTKVAASLSASNAYLDANVVATNNVFSASIKSGDSTVLASAASTTEVRRGSIAAQIASM